MSEWRLRRAARRIAFALLALTATVAAATSLAAAAPQTTIESFYSVLLSTMKNGPTLGVMGRYQQIAPEIKRSFDISYMAHMAVGAAWSTLSDEEKQRVSEAFGRYIAATYADNFDSYSGEKFEVTGQQTTPYGTIVESRIVKSDGEPVAMNYLMRQNNGEWLVTDIYLTGTISQVATLRSQFSSVLASDGVAGLITALNRKSQTLTASPASFAGPRTCPPRRAPSAC
ncbi:MAG TPA: ABC transporter substrate-binding protein [Stellaceae bacterium]|nr:ABC transporter substrate-binding protein [Stellaceae bacterium]